MFVYFLFISNSLAWFFFQNHLIGSDIFLIIITSIMARCDYPYVLCERAINSSVCLNVIFKFFQVTHWQWFICFYIYALQCKMLSFNFLTAYFNYKIVINLRIIKVFFFVKSLIGFKLNYDDIKGFNASMKSFWLDVTLMKIVSKVLNSLRLISVLNECVQKIYKESLDLFTPESVRIRNNPEISFIDHNLTNLDS